ncbi:MAG TPA: hypothetical protein VG963_28995, partial [Polyangiaceae bacterium]|nr:hypothetical protein [Polyangiaceae bacterium]
MFGLWAQALQLWSLLAVALQSPAPNPELLAIALASCSEALGNQRCYEPSAPEVAAEPEAVIANVSWDPDWLSAQVELRRMKDQQPLAVRTVQFSAADPLEERFRALGLIIAAHALSQVEKPPPAQAERALLREGLDMFVFGGAALDRGAGRAGLALRGWMRPGTWPLMMLLSVRGAYRPGEPRVMWATATAGAGLHLEPSARPFALESRLELVGQRTQVSATSDGQGRARAGAFRWGGQFGLEISGRLWGRFWLFGGGEVAWLTPRVRVHVAGEPAGNESPFGWALLA